MKITEDTTLAELAVYCAKLGGPTISIGNWSRRTAVVYLPALGTFEGTGDTEAQALAEAFTRLESARARQFGGAP